MMFKSLMTGGFLWLSVVGFAQTGDPSLMIRQTEVYGQKVAQVSFDGDQLPFGVVTIADHEGKVIYRMEEAELVAAPNYFTIGLDEFPKGQYVMTVETKLKKYTQSFNIH